MQPTVAVIDDGGDALASQVARRLAARGREPLVIDAAGLAKAALELSASGVSVNGRPLAAVLFRARLPGWFADGFVAQDAPFCHGEAAAAWMAILEHESVLAINRLDPQLWFTHVEWPCWWKRLEAAGVPVAPIEVGDVAAPDARWLPWSGGVARWPGVHAARCFASAWTSQPPIRVGVWLRGRHLAGHRAACGEAAAGVLAGHGAVFAEIATTAEETVVSCTAHPTSAVERAAGALTEEIDAHLHRW